LSSGGHASRRLLRDQLIEDLLQVVFGDRARHDLGTTIIVHEHPRRLVRDAEPSPQRPVLRHCLRKRQGVLVDECLHRVAGIETRHAKELDLSAVVARDPCDFRGFPLTDPSPRSPEPDREILADITRAPDGSAAEHGGGEVEHLRQRLRAARVEAGEPYTAEDHNNPQAALKALNFQKQQMTACDCGAEPVPCVVLDPFVGSGTTLVVAKKLHRDAIGIELSPKYISIIERRLRQTQETFFPA